ncbi:hypothetical protein FCZ59_20415 [Escherichia coli]|nr:UvrD-helicase domain-containing protein [Escherichia coli]MDN1856519.1 hypothetical protein [Escherichia coli]HDQ3766435.1 UvrD-helicase domain-containing protein [Escherichia coli]
MSGFLEKIAFWFIKEQLKSIRADEYKSGWSKGYSEGIYNGRKEGYEEGKNIVVIQDERRIHLSDEIDSSIYGPRYFPVTDSMKKDMKSAVAAAVAEGIVSMPTCEQWNMIFSEYPTTCVVAGAGSGKSTTLVLRVIFMHCYLKIPLEEITVVSFTKESCKELTQKIQKVLRYWCPELDSLPSGFVRTFHSALVCVCRELLGVKYWFDMLKDEDNTSCIDDGEIDNPFSFGRLSVTQKNFLNKIYIELFNSDERFRDNVLSLMKETVLYTPLSEKTDIKHKAFENAAWRDLNLALLLNKTWSDKGLWPIEGVSDDPVSYYSIGEKCFYANGVIKSTGQLVFLGRTIGREHLYDKDEVFNYTDASGKESEFPLNACLSLRDKIMASKCHKSMVFIDSSSKLDMVRFLAKFDAENNAKEAPFFDVQLNGEYLATNIVELMYSQASFVESLGLEVGELLEKIRPFKSKGLEFYFCQILPVFWRKVEHEILKSGGMTFNRAFMTLSDDAFWKKHGDRIKTKLSMFRHLLIDEFQDISPQIAMWIRAIHQELSRQEKEPSIMVIGDDWQSIYSWRGSSPEIFMNFTKFFPSHEDLHGGHYIHMMDNFRSDEKIIRDAERLMKYVSTKIEKKAISRREPDGDESSVNFIEYDVSSDKWLDAVVKCIYEQFALVSEQKKCDKNKVIVLGRTKNVLDKVKKAGKKFPSGVVFHTIHAAKGLQGEVAIILEDSLSVKGHIFRNRVYEATGFFSLDYDASMRDEAIRLAYVAITRGVKRVYWFAPTESTGAFKILKRACIVSEKRKL